VQSVLNASSFKEKSQGSHGNECLQELSMFKSGKEVIHGCTEVYGNCFFF